MIIAVDTGGTKTLIVAFDTDGVKTQIARFPTPKDIPEYVTAVASAINGFTSIDQIDIIALAVPGSIRDGVLLHAENLGWYQSDILAQVQASFPSTRVVIGNDADIAGLGEMRSRDIIPHTGLYVTFSTGIGTGLCFDGKLPESMEVFEGGKMRFEYEGKMQRWEDFASGRNFYERYQQFGSDVDDPEKWQDYAQRAACGLAVLIPTFEPEIVVVGGSMGTHYAKYQEFLNQELSQIIPKYMENTTLVQANHPEEAVVDGCYYFALDAMAD